MGVEKQSSLILNVNDRETARYYISIVLRRAGFRVMEAATGAEALAAAHQLPDVIVLDVNLPDLNGHQVCRKLRADPVTAGVSILQTSATYGALATKLEGLSSGADGYLAQPFEPEELIAMVRALIRARSAERTLNEALQQAEHAQQHAESALRTRDEFIGMASHELRNPASAVHLQLESVLRLVRGGEVPVAVLEKKLALASQSSRHLVGMLHNLLDASGIREGRLELRSEEIELGAVVAAVAARMEDEAARADCVIDVHMPAPVCGTWDRARVDQITTNLLSNALKYASGGPVAVAVVPWTNDAALLTVRDHGPGIPVDAQARIFDRFERASTDIRTSGFGLGLWIVRSIVDAMGGAIAVENHTTGGAAFKVLLPRGQHSGVQTARTG